MGAVKGEKVATEAPEYKNRVLNGLWRFIGKWQQRTASPSDAVSQQFGNAKPSSQAGGDTSNVKPQATLRR
jgi:hypothetical protein